MIAFVTVLFAQVQAHTFSFGEWMAIAGVLVTPATAVAVALIKMFAEIAGIKSDVKHVRGSCDELCDRVERIEDKFMKGGR